jgi:hypothetical protein
MRGTVVKRLRKEAKYDKKNDHSELTIDDNKRTVRYKAGSPRMIYQELKRKQ